MAPMLVAVALSIGLTVNVVAQCSFQDTFNSFSSDPAVPSSVTSTQPYGAALEYPGFTYYRTATVNSTNDTVAILTNAKVQAMTIDQPTFLRYNNVISFDLFSLQFACAYETPALRGALVFPSCLIRVACQPMSASPTIPNGHRPVKQPMVQQYFKFVGNHNGTTKQNIGDLFLKPDSFSSAIFSAGFDNLDYCYLMIEQTSAIPSLGQSAIGSASLLISNVEGVAKGVNCSTA